MAPTSGRPDREQRSRAFGVLPSIRHPRLLVPLAPRQAAATALAAYGGRLELTDRLAYRSLGVALRLAGPATLPTRLAVTPAPPRPGIDIDVHLSELLGTPISVAIHLTPARANRKPIVQALSATSHYPAAFVKVAGNALTAELVGREAAALTTIADRGAGAVLVPEVIDCRAVNGHQTLVMRPLPTWSRGRLPTGDELARGAADVASLGDGATTSVRESAFWQRLRSDIELAVEPTIRDALRRVADRLETSVGSADITTGAGHGDWSPWNMWQTARGLLVWDWERFALDVPVGSDLAHYRLQELLVIKGARPIDAARAAVDQAPLRLPAVLHLMTLAVRYAKDDQAAAGASLPSSDQWLLPVVDEALRLGVASSAGSS